MTNRLAQEGAAFVAVARKMIYGAIAAGLLSIVVAVAWEPFRTWAVSMIHLPESVAENARATAANARAIDRLRLPSNIFEVSPRSGPVRGHCVSGVNCVVKVRVRRLPDAMPCEIIAGSADYYYRNPRDNETHDVTIVSGQPRDVGTTWINLTFTLSTPFSLEPDAELCVRPAYLNCPGQLPEDGAIAPDEECFEVQVRSAARHE